MSTKTLSAAAAAISADLRQSLNFSASETSKELDNTVYLAHAEKAGVSEQQIVDVKQYDRTYTAGLMDAVSDAGLAAIKADPSLVEVKLEVTAAGVKGETFGATYTGKRTGTMKGQNGAPDTDWTSWGGVRASHKSIISGKGGDQGIAMNLAAAAAEEALAAATK